MPDNSDKPEERKLTPYNSCTTCKATGVQLFYCWNCHKRFCIEHRSAKPLCADCDADPTARRPNRADRRKIGKGLKAVGVKDE